MVFEFKKLNLEGLILIIPKCFKDERGLFLESYKKSDFLNNGISCEFVQDNHSKSKKNVLRGLHYQSSPKSQAKLIRCMKGRVLDVAVDLRPNSRTYKKHVKIELSEDNKQMLFIPQGFAHGFIALSNEAELVYKTSEEYSPEHDRGVFWNDEDLAIDWGIESPILSEKDKNQPKLSEIDKSELI